MQSILNKYAKLLVDYSLEIKKGEKLYVRSTTLAEPLVREVYREAVIRGAHVEVDLAFRGKNRIFLENASPEQISQTPYSYQHAIEKFDAYLMIRAPYNLKEDQNIDNEKRRLRSNAMKPISQIYSKRTASGELKRSLCQYPTQACAQEADMSLEEYQYFVYNACHLYADDPIAEWKKVGAGQEQIVNYLNGKDQVRYMCNGTDITFSVKDRIWINSDGKANMPSGEVFSGPVEDSVNGVVHFNYPAIFMGKEVKDITLWVEKGEVKKWEAKIGQDVLDRVFEMDGARYFGEVAIGTNYNIQQATKNILFDEKIGGTIHMAVGQSYKQTGGKNESSIHWDMITDMKDGGKILVDGDLVYENGKFLIFD